MKKQLIIRLDENTHKKLKVLAAKDLTSIQKILEKLIKELVK